MAILVMAVAVTQGVMAYNFSAVSPSGHRLFYTLDTAGGVNHAKLTHKNPYVPSSPYANPVYDTLPVGNLVIPDSVVYNGTTYAVTSIGYAAFAYCPSLHKVSLPASLTLINREAFQNDSTIDTIILASIIPPTLEDSVFYYYTATLIVPCGSADTYRQHEVWALFANIVENCDGIDNFEIRGTEPNSTCTGTVEMSNPSTVSTDFKIIPVYDIPNPDTISTLFPNPATDYVQVSSAPPQLAVGFTPVSFQFLD